MLNCEFEPYLLNMSLRSRSTTPHVTAISNLSVIGAEYHFSSSNPATLDNDNGSTIPGAPPSHAAGASLMLGVLGWD